MTTLLLPSGPIKIIRDAARAAKRTAGLMVKRVTADTLSILLGLPGRVVTEYALEKQAGQEILTFSASMSMKSLNVRVAVRSVKLCMKRRSVVFVIWTSGER